MDCVGFFLVVAIRFSSGSASSSFNFRDFFLGGGTVGTAEAGEAAASSLASRFRRSSAGIVAGNVVKGQKEREELSNRLRSQLDPK